MGNQVEGATRASSEADRKRGEPVLFVGTHERQLDEKGRLALPATFRSHLGEHCYLTIGIDKCLNVIAADTFESKAAELMGQVARGEVSRQRQRAFAASASLVTIDKQGRVSIDDRLRDYAELTPRTNVTVTGNLDVIELWSPERFRQINDEGTSDLAEPA